MKIQSVTVAYDSVPVLRDFTLEIGEGELVGIIGPNGSGKTTLLRTIARLLKPLKGAVFVGELDLKSVSVREIARNIAVVPQEDVTLFALTVFDVVAMGRTAYCPPWGSLGKDDINAIEEAMAQTETEKLAMRVITELSGGERKRVMIARALAQRPRILLLDEPTANLDLKYQLEVIELIRRLNREHGTTVITVLHDLNLAPLIADKLVLMNSGGKIHALGTPEEVITQRNIQEAYGAPVVVSRNPLTGKPSVTLLERRIVLKPNLRIHLICGGGSAGEILSLLIRSGCDVSVGALNRGDSDWEAARALGATLIEEAPFMPISERAYRETCRAISQSEVVLITDVPFGFGNLLNLQAVIDAASGRVFIMRPKEFSGRDFTNGEATRLLRQIYSTKQVVELNNIQELIRLLSPSDNPT
ncbi:MAG: ABC transporter ATP-binding protein [Armatimonadetes bacterium]|nr:ABC transporter ATP-binding protein [Armatimonadota bacterium]